MSNVRMETGAEDATYSLEEITELITRLDELAGELLRVMEEQIESVVASHPEKVEQFTEEHTELKAEFKKQEVAFVEELNRQVQATFGKSEPVKLEMLKQVYPGSAPAIDQWRALLRDNSRKLKRKHQQLVDLLRFAMGRNTEMMHSIYHMYNKNNTHYSSTGGTSDVASGMAINQEV
ncbi:flagellar export chaperone FlgN [Aliifodinibius sp. S!AR15-10]|uniref:flagellar export chaperone FlgN n=1 Tax=Aliifodinibius sp. S!AR15-10 TaxID=2950437 RepID=UPI002864E358|nr:flagellar export chaperone FlgN [Aliifodinibius sp. S!AR15-10]MDR8394642.1 flagellar export chaperone FlgN [Aliifodinibius sp. S!AR15-10]